MSVYICIYLQVDKQRDMKKDRRWQRSDALTIGDFVQYV